MNRQFDNGQTPIHMAAENGKHSQVIKLYTQHSMNIISQVSMI